MKKNSSQKLNGFTLIELMMVVSIISILASVAIPKFIQLTNKAYQAKGKSNLGSIRSAISIYYSENEGKYPLQFYADNAPPASPMSLTRVLTPRYMGQVPIPELKDGLTVHNGSCGSYDAQAQTYMTASPVVDVYLLVGANGAYPGVCLPFMYDHHGGIIYYHNDNLDGASNHIYNW